MDLKTRRPPSIERAVNCGTIFLHFLLILSTVLVVTSCSDSKSLKENSPGMAEKSAGETYSHRTRELTESDKIQRDAEYVAYMIIKEIDSGSLSVEDLAAERFDSAKYMETEGIFFVHYATMEQIGISVRMPGSDLPEISTLDEMKYG